MVHGPACGRFRPDAESDDSEEVHYLNAVLQRFSARWTELARVRKGGFGIEIAGWCCRVRIYSRRPTEYFGVSVEEFDEAYLSAKSPQESQDARLPQAHELGGRSQGRGEPPAPGPQASGSLTVVPKQAHAPD